MGFEFIANTLQAREAATLRRIRQPVISNKHGMVEIQGQHYLNFASNDYLGLSQHEQVLQSYVEGLAVYGSGSGASSIVTGYSAEHKALEDDICEVLNKPAAMLFSSGFAANQAICHALFGHLKHQAGNNDTSQVPQIICDKYMHASFIQGALDTNAKLRRFAHNNMEQAQTLIAAATPSSLVATEGVFSMDGDRGDVKSLQNIIHASGEPANDRPWLMVDDAHAFGVIGKNGFGTLDCKNINSAQVNIVMGTFGKALGTSGAFVAGSEQFIEYMVNISKHYVYSTAISGAQVRATRASLALVEKGEERAKLYENIEYFSRLAANKGLVTLPSNSAIQVIIVGDAKLALSCSEQLAKLGLWVPAIRTPTVPKNTDRLRITLSAIHNKKDIEALVDGLTIVFDKVRDIKPSSLATPK
jgi:8-amino-7-oxononanoate synthase